MSRTVTMNNCSIKPDEMHRMIQIGLASRYARKWGLPEPPFENMTIEQIEKYVESMSAMDK